MRESERGRARETLAALFPNEFLVSLQIECLKLRLAGKLLCVEEALHRTLELKSIFEVNCQFEQPQSPPSLCQTQFQPNLNPICVPSMQINTATRRDTKLAAKAARNLLKTIESVQSWQGAEIFTA